MYATRYIKPENLDAAISALHAADEGKILAGGMTLIPTLKQRLAAPDCLIDITALGLSGIRQQGDKLIIGAMSCHAEVEHSALVASEIPVLAQLAGGIGDRQVRNRGTIGGSLANNDPAACYPAAVLALAASIQTSKRLIAADDFFTGMFETALAEDEIITEIHFPKVAKAAYVKFGNPASRYAMVGVCVALHSDGSVRVAITGAGQDGVFRHAGLEAALQNSLDASNPVADAVDKVDIDESDLMSDIHASADYRAHLITEITKRAVRAL
jgi:carbon-monoxide dehydrogenase medium subunit